MGSDYNNPAVTSQSVFLESIRGVTYIPTRTFSERIQRISCRSETVSEREEHGANTEENQNMENNDNQREVSCITIMCVT